jgi:hypothetical protein
MKERVIVVGGGNVAVDAALTALRRGASEVTMACLEKREEMPAHPWGVKRALAEGVKLMPSWGPHKIVSEKGKIKGLEMIHCVSAFDEICVFKPSFDETKQMVEADQVILAIGQASDLSFLEPDHGIQVKRGLIVVDEATQETGMKGVYAGGDVAAAPGAIIHAIAAGRKAALPWTRPLEGPEKSKKCFLKEGRPAGAWAGMRVLRPGPGRGFLNWPLRSAARGLKKFLIGFTDEQALKEAARCLQCDLRLFMGCNPSPPQKVIAFKEANIREVPEEEGVFLLYDSEHNVLAIKGTADLRRDLLLCLEGRMKKRRGSSLNLTRCIPREKAS